jgi:Cu(I)/Ag(I) efflux system membrane fusion protein
LDKPRRTEKAAREKLRLLGLSKAQIDAVVKSGTPSDQIVLTAPMSGVVTAKEVDEGMYVKTGSVIYRIADLSRVWVVLDAYESDLPWVRMGKHVEFTAEAFPGKTFEGKVVFIDPVVDPVKRTVRVRLEAPNPGYELKPGMFVRAVQQSDPASEPSLVIPASAPLITGKRAVVYVAAPGQDGVYEGREIVLGPRAGDFYVVKSGLAQGEQVVTRGNFKIDSALQIQAKPSMMNPESGTPAPAHDHGQAAEGEPMEMDAPSSFAVPGGFIAQLAPLIENYEGLASAVDSGDLATSRQAFMDFHQAIGSVDGAGLEGDAALAFKELSMLLSNDSLIGAEAETMGNARFEFSQVKRNYQRLYADFGLAATAESMAMAKSVPEAFKTQLGDVFEAYVPLRKALAGDDFEAAKAAVDGVSQAVAHVDMGLLPHEPHMLWMEHLQGINQGLSAIAGAGDITAARAGFEPLSIGLAEAMKALGANTDTPVYQLFCPMAFENKGAIWLQTHEAIENPYFGAAMFACGESQGRIGR